MSVEYFHKKISDSILTPSDPPFTPHWPLMTTCDSLDFMGRGGIKSGCGQGAWPRGCGRGGSKITNIFFQYFFSSKFQKIVIIPKKHKFRKKYFYKMGVAKWRGCGRGGPLWARCAARVLRDESQKQPSRLLITRSCLLLRCDFCYVSSLIHIKLVWIVKLA